MGMGWLVVTAAAKEHEAVRRGLCRAGWIPEHEATEPWESSRGFCGDVGVALVRSGVGMANGAGATAWMLATGTGSVQVRSMGVCSLGLAGALGPGIDLCGVVLATESVHADTGLVLPDAGFRPMKDAGFPLIEPTGGDGVTATPETLGEAARALGSRGGSGIHRGVVATVAGCSSSDHAARAIADRTGAIAEAMEGASVGSVASRLGLAFLEVRVISNTTGDRDRQQWDLSGALATLEAVAAALAAGWSRGEGSGR